jgi:hypothetical protein
MVVFARSEKCFNSLRDTIMRRVLDDVIYKKSEKSMLEFWMSLKSLARYIQYVLWYHIYIMESHSD